MPIRKSSGQYRIPRTQYAQSNNNSNLSLLIGVLIFLMLIVIISVGVSYAKGGGGDDEEEETEKMSGKKTSRSTTREKSAGKNAFPQHRIARPRAPKSKREKSTAKEKVKKQGSAIKNTVNSRNKKKEKLTAVRRSKENLTYQKLYGGEPSMDADVKVDYPSALQGGVSEAETKAIRTSTFDERANLGKRMEEFKRRRV